MGDVTPRRIYALANPIFKGPTTKWYMCEALYPGGTPGNGQEVSPSFTTLGETYQQPDGGWAWAFGDKIGICPNADEALAALYDAVTAGGDG
jgi:hypothetical protein